MFVVELGHDLSLIVFACGIWAAPWTCRSMDVRAGIGTRLNINCVHMWNLGSASGITQWIVIVRGKIGTRLVIDSICQWSLGSASGVTWRIVDVRGLIGMRLVINIICLWNSGSASGITWPDKLWMFVVQLGWYLSLIAFTCGIWERLRR